MEKKLTDMVKIIEDELLVSIEEEEIDEEMACRIKARALAGVSKNSLSFKDKLTKRILLVAVLTALLTTAVGAMSSSRSIHQFFSRHLSIILPSTQEVRRSVAYNGITMTIDTAFGGNSGSVVVVNFTKDDGTPFEEGVQFKKFEVDVKEGSSRGYGVSWELSDDRNVLTYIVDLKTNGNLSGKEVEITASDLVTITPNEEVIPLDLKKVYEEQKIKVEKEKESSFKEEKDEAEHDIKEDRLETRDYLKGIVLNHLHSDVVLREINFEDNMKFVFDYTQVDKSLTHMFRLMDTRTGKSLVEDARGMRSSSKHEVQMEIWEYKELTPQDLAYIQMVMMSNNYDYLNQGEWQLSFILEKNKHVKNIVQKQKVPIKYGVYIINEGELSVLGLHLDGKVKGLNGKENLLADEKLYEALNNLKTYLVMENGDKIEVRTTISSGSSDIFIAFMEALSPDGWESLTEEEKQKRHEENRSKNGIESNGFGYIRDEKQYINVDKVKALEIEGVRIHLK